VFGFTASIAATGTKEEKAIVHDNRNIIDNIIKKEQPSEILIFTTHISLPIISQWDYKTLF